MDGGGDIEAVNGGGGPVKSAARALDLLDDIAHHGPSSLPDLVARLGIPKSSLHGILRTMTARGWLQLDPGGYLYRLGLRPLQVGATFQASDPVLSRSAPLLDHLTATGRPVVMGRLSGLWVVVTAAEAGPHPVPRWVRVGQRVPVHENALGIALLAHRGRGDSAAEDLAPGGGAARAAAALRAARQEDHASVDEEDLDLRWLAVVLPASRPVVDAVAVGVSRTGPEELRGNVVEMLLAVRASLEGTSRRADD